MANKVKLRSIGSLLTGTVLAALLILNHETETEEA